MRARILPLTAFAIGALALAAPVAGTAAGGKGGRPLHATLLGATEVPNPGDANATGTVKLRLNSGQRRICYRLIWRDIDGTVSAAHIHEAPTGQAGPIRVNLFVAQTLSGTGSKSDCVTASRAQIKDIRKDPADYYVNVHSTPNFPGGAIRGQLQK